MTMLSQLIPDVSLKRDVMIGGITDDSRNVKRGDLFVAMPGIHNDGRDYIHEVEGLAAAVICEFPPPSKDISIPVIGVKGLREKTGDIASRYFGMPSQQLAVFAVTGTNGKTSVASFVAHAATRLGRKCGVIGTLGSGIPSAMTVGSLTTPDAITLQSEMATLLDEGCSMVAIEASSHGLAQGRLNGTSIEVAAITNITRDHLDYHNSFDDYVETKRRLLEWPTLKTAIFNMDDPRAEEISRSATGEIISYGLAKSADVIARSIELSASGLSFDLTCPWGEAKVTSRLLGRFNVSNLLATVSVLGAMGFEFQKIADVLGQIENVPGRMDAMREDGLPLVVIDYAHTPDALENSLLALREHMQGQVWCVFGCGGNRDAGKRPQMGEVASRLADHVVITNDNPRDEEPQSIANEIYMGMETEALIDLSRSSAIRWAIESADVGDVVLIAGKGHENYQEIGGEKRPYSDFAAVAQSFSAAGLT